MGQIIPKNWKPQLNFRTSIPDKYPLLTTFKVTQTEQPLTDQCESHEKGENYLEKLQAAIKLSILGFPLGNRPSEDTIEPLTAKI